MKKTDNYKIEDGKKSKAFTLIELLVVISIIAILMAIMMPALSRVREQGKAVTCRSRLKQWGIAFYLYGADNSGRIPFYVDDFRKQTEREKIYWYELLSPYVQAQSDDNRGDGFDNEIRKCTVHTPTMPVNFGVNFSWDGETAPFCVGINANGKVFLPFNLAKIKNPDLVMTLTETGGYPFEQGDEPHEGRWVYNPRAKGYGFSYDFDKDGIVDSFAASHPFNAGNPKVHMNGSNVLLFDGHSEWVSYQDLWLDQESISGRGVPKHRFWKL